MSRKVESTAASSSSAETPRAGRLGPLDWLDARTDWRRWLTGYRGRQLTTGPSWWLTSASCLFWLLAIELVTGLTLMTSYSPSMTAAWASVHFIERSAAGSLVRGIHYFTSHALLLVFVVHVARVLITAGFRAPRELIWITGLLLMPLVLAWTVTGNPLAASQKGLAQIEVEANIIESTPWIGPAIRRILIGGDEPGSLTLTHLYFLHVGLIPLLITPLLVLHISQVYRYGWSHAPLGDGAPPGTPVSYWPEQTARNLTVLTVLLGTIVWMAWRDGAPLDVPADPNLPSTPRPEWYFRWLFELRRYFIGPWEFLATVVFPALVLGYFLSVPLFDRLLPTLASAALRWLTVLGGLAALLGLSWVSMARDWNDAHYRAAQDDGERLAQRARLLADRQPLPVEGGITLLRGDPKTQGPALFARHCKACHSHSDAEGRGLVAENPSAPNLFGFATPEWIEGMLSPEGWAGSAYFGHTKLAEGDMAGKLGEMFDEASEEPDRAELRRKLALAARALSAEASLSAWAEADARDIASVDEGRALVAGDLACTDCHKLGDAGELGSAPDLSGYGSREWLAGMIANPAHERFYADDRNDRMPAFAANPARPEANVLSADEMELLISWLRGEWFEPSK